MDKTPASTAVPVVDTAIPESVGGALPGPDFSDGSTGTRWTIRIIAIALLAGSTALMFAPVSREIVGTMALVAMLTLIFLKVPVAVALGAPGIVGLYALYGPRAAENVLSTLPYEVVAEWSLSVIPMFVLMGMLLSYSGMTVKVYTAAQHWLGWMPGGLAVGTNMAGAGLAAVSGSTIATTHALARAGIPEMLRAGYDRRLSVGSVVVASLPGHLIPPSIFMVIYAGVAQVPVGPQLMAGVLPGIMVVVCVCVMILVLCAVRPALAPRGTGAEGADLPTVTWGMRWRSALGTWPVPVLILVVLGGLYTGTVTATEAGAAGAVGAMLITFWYKRKERPFTAVRQAAVDTALSVGAIFFMLVGAYVLARLLAVSGLANGFADWVTRLELGRVEFLLLMMVVYIVLGMFMDSISMMLLTVPLLIPTLETLDISLLWFGVFVVFMAELSIITPPVGILSFIVHSIVQDKKVNQGVRISLGDVMWAVVWFMPIAIVFVLLLIFFPEVATYLPDRMSN